MKATFVTQYNGKCNTNRSDHLLAVGGAGSTPPWHAWGTVLTPALGLQILTGCGLQSCLRSPKTSCCIPGRAHAAGCALALLPPAPHAQTSPGGTGLGPAGRAPSHPLPSSTGRAGRAQQRGRSPALCCAGFGHLLLPVSQPWCHGAGGLLGPCPVPSSAPVSGSWPAA